MIAPLLLAVAPTMTFTADRIAADGTTRALTATGHVVAVCEPFTLRGEQLVRTAEGKHRFFDPTYATTCTNALGHTHWNVTGEIEYQEKDFVILRNMTLRFYEVPIFWLPYMYYPLETDCGFSWMPGYTGRWGGFLLTKYAYHLLGDERYGDDTRWLKGDTRLDLRYRQGVAVGEDLDWNLSDWGKGGLSLYYAWDDDAERYYGRSRGDYEDSNHSLNWESPVERERYSFVFKHRLDLTERDTVRLQASVLSDSAFRDDFVRRATLLEWEGSLQGYENSGVFWEHLENAFSIGAEVSGRLNEFYGMTDRLPEIYLDVNPRPVWDSPLNYESENRFGYLRRNPAEYGTGDPSSVYTFNPGPWASYDAFRFDTYHRLTAPFRTLDDLLSVVPRVAYRGTYWSESGKDNLTGWGCAEDAGPEFRSVLESGVTFAGRGTAWVDERWQHMLEPYLDFLAQRAWYSAYDRRPYVFDSVDESVMWEDQFAGRSRNLPYSYYGMTPGLRNAWERADDKGRLRQIVDLDAYAALQFNRADFFGDDDAHRLSRIGNPHYGKHGCFVSPGARIRWNPDRDISLLARAEYDSDNNTIAFGDVGWRQKVSERFSYNVKYALRDYRWWDFSSTPYDERQMRSDDFNYAKMHYVHVGLENQPLEWFAWGPYVRWDIKENELDRIGTWFDYLTDCLGFRFIVEYMNSCTRIDGYEREEDWSFGFYIYLRAFGPSSGNVLGN